MGWKCVHGRPVCRACNFNLKDLQYTQGASKEETQRAWLAQIEQDLREGDSIILGFADPLVIDGLMPHGVQLSINDVNNARHNMAHEAEARKSRRGGD